MDVEDARDVDDLLLFTDMTVPVLLNQRMLRSKKGAQFRLTRTSQGHTLASALTPRAQS